MEFQLYNCSAVQCSALLSRMSCATLFVFSQLRAFRELVCLFVCLSVLRRSESKFSPLIAKEKIDSGGGGVGERKEKRDSFGPRP